MLDWLLFYMIFFGVMGTIWGKIKDTWKQGNKLSAMLWIVIAVMVFFIFLFFKVLIKEEHQQAIFG